MSGGDDLSGGEVNEDRRKQLKEQIEHEQFKRIFAKRLAWLSLTAALILLFCLVIYTLFFTHEYADIPAIAALSGVPTLLLIGLMRYFLPKPQTKESNEEDGSGENISSYSYHLAFVVANAVQSALSGKSNPPN